ncbi:hypothetical protein Tco_1150399, partial [Tanacetum coccineum]
TAGEKVYVAGLQLLNVGKYKSEGQSTAKLKVKVLLAQYTNVKVLPLI